MLKIGYNRQLLTARPLCFEGDAGIVAVSSTKLALVAVSLAITATHWCKV